MQKRCSNCILQPRCMNAASSIGFHQSMGGVSRGPHPAGWAQATGQDFIGNHDLPNIHYAAIHAWADNWQVDTKFLTQWVQNHMADAKAMGKPLVLEEFGKNVTDFAPETIAKVRGSRVSRRSKEGVGGLVSVLLSRSRLASLQAASSLVCARGRA